MTAKYVIFSNGQSVVSEINRPKMGSTFLKNNHYLGPDCMLPLTPMIEAIGTETGHHV